MAAPLALSFTTCRGLLVIRLQLQGVTATFPPLGIEFQPCRYASYVNKWMRRDVIRREFVKRHNQERICLNAIRKNRLLPKELQEQADMDIAQLPRDAFPNRLHNRCVLTSRPRGLYQRYRLSRIQWRLLADYNKLSGVTRASW